MIDPRALINVQPFSWDGEKLVLGEHACEIDETAYVGPLTVVQFGNVRRTKIGARTKIDAGCHIGHDVQIAEDCTITAHAVIAGHVTIERNVYIGIGALVKQRLTIGRDAMIGMGAVVIRDIAPNTVVVGNPAREIGKRFK